MKSKQSTKRETMNFKEEVVTSFNHNKSTSFSLNIILFVQAFFCTFFWEMAKIYDSFLFYLHNVTMITITSGHLYYV